MMKKLICSLTLAVMILMLGSLCAMAEEAVDLSVPGSAKIGGLSMKYHGWNEEEYRKYLLDRWDNQSNIQRGAAEVEYSIDGIPVGEKGAWSIKYGPGEKTARGLLEGIIFDGIMLRDVEYSSEEAVSRALDRGQAKVELVESELYYWRWKDDGKVMICTEYYLFRIEYEGTLYNVIGKIWGEVLNYEYGVKEVQEWRIWTEEYKGQTVLCVQGESVDEEESRYALVVRDGEDETIYLKNEHLIKKEDEYWKMLDFSTELNLETGYYDFAVVPVSDLSEPDFVFSHVYDEQEKHSGDDPHGNEREYRRLLSHEEGNPLDNVEICANMRTRLTNAGLTGEDVSLIFSHLRGADAAYRDAYLYGFYAYYFEGASDKAEYNGTANTSYFNGGDSESDRYYCYFHEVGHALDGNGIRLASGERKGEFVSGKYFSKYMPIVDDQQIEKYLRDIMREDAAAWIDAEIEVWLSERDGDVLTETEKEAIREKVKKDEGWVLSVLAERQARTEIAEKETRIRAARQALTEAEQQTLREKVVDAILCANHVQYGLFTADERVPEDFSELERAAYLMVIDRLENWLAGTKKLNGNMADAFAGLSNNKIKSPMGHTGSDWEHYWYADNGEGNIEQTGNPGAEGWAEFYSAQMMRDEELIALNRELFPEACEYYEGMIAYLQSHYRDKLLIGSALERQLTPEG